MTDDEKYMYERVTQIIRENRKGRYEAKTTDAILAEFTITRRPESPSDD